MYFTAGAPLTGSQAALLNEMARQYLRYGARVRVTNWPLSVHEAGRLGGQIIGFDPKALAGPASGSGGGVSHTTVAEVPCVNGVLQVWKQDVYADGSTSAPYYAYAAGCCDCGNTGSGSGSGSGGSGGSGGGGGATASCATGTCSGRTLNSVLYATLTTYGTIPLTWTGTYWQGSSALSCGETLYLRYSTACLLEFSCNGISWASGSTVGVSYSCTGNVFLATGNWTVNMDNFVVGCTPGGCPSTVNVVSVGE